MMTLEKNEMISRKTISIERLKNRFTKNYPNSSVVSYLQDLPDEINIEELIGATAILLNMLDMESNKNMKSQIKGD
ncbi:MAG: hypothetical protein QXL94_01385 [Candidatus Parvarchaeum sp.]